MNAVTAIYTQIRSFVSLWEFCGEKQNIKLLKNKWEYNVKFSGLKGIKIVISRRRLGHTFQTHGHLMNNEMPDVQFICDLCNNVANG